jgi:hypothetical protein
MAQNKQGPPFVVKRRFLDSPVEYYFQLPEGTTPDSGEKYYHGTWSEGTICYGAHDSQSQTVLHPVGDPTWSIYGLIKS